jgi:hypothetical protein
LRLKRYWAITNHYRPFLKNWLRTHIRKERHCRRDLAILYLSSIPLFKNIEFTFEGPKSPIFVMLTHTWTILSRMLLTLWKDGKTSFKIEQDHDSIKISVTDRNGIQKKRVFEPGFTTKKEAGD